MYIHKPVVKKISAELVPIRVLPEYASSVLELHCVSLSQQGILHFGLQLHLGGKIGY